ncbi:MAG: DUF3341 domain-containing protein [Fimbriimonadales bacterium]|nr:DUF3341 domain-containing protein [Fimbriimonadales bacterium]
MAHDWSDPSGLYALVGEFNTPEELMHAAEAARHAGYRKMDAYSPFPIHGLSEAIGFRDTKVPWTVFMFGLLGVTTGYTLQWWTSVIDYPLNVGGKPLNSIPPQPYHPIFNAKNFERASQDKFFLAVEAVDPHYDAKKIEKVMKEHGAVEVSECEY